MPTSRPITVHAPAAVQVSVHTRARTDRSVTEVRLDRDDGGSWVGAHVADVGDEYWIVADGSGPLLDPHTFDVVMTADGPRSVVRDPWPVHPRGEPLDLPAGVQPVVYELHVRGFNRTFAAAVERFDHLARLGVDVIEVMPVHPFDPTDNYWGYMPLVWGAVHRPYAAGSDAAEELAWMIAAAHRRGMHVWLDVVYNHTGEGEASLPTWSLRGLDDANAYRHHPDGSYTDDSGCGNDIDPSNPEVRRLILESLDRYADLGVDGFRFDLASLLTRDGGELVAMITAWARGRGVVLVAEAWDLAVYQVGDGFPDRTWMQWNDRFRDDVRGFLRAEPGLVSAIEQRVQGSPDVFGESAPHRSVNFIAAHDGLTKHDLTLVTSDHHRSWDAGPDLRLQQMKNYFTMLLLSAGTPMFVMGDEFARTQLGHDNPYNIDSPLTWIDWSRLDAWRELVDVVAALVRLRRECPPVGMRFYGARHRDVDRGYESRSIAWATDDLYVMVNAWWEPLQFEVFEPGAWSQQLLTAPMIGPALAPRSIRVLRKQSATEPQPSGVEAQAQAVE